MRADGARCAEALRPAQLRFRLHCSAARVLRKTRGLWGNDQPGAAGYVDLPERWRYASARCYAGLPGVMEIDGWG